MQVLPVSIMKVAWPKLPMCLMVAAAQSMSLFRLRDWLSMSQGLFETVVSADCGSQL